MAAPKGNQYAKGNKGGRPIIWDDDAIENEAAALIEWIQQPKNNYIGNFAFDRGYDRAQMHHFAEKNKEFANAYKRAKQWQENIFSMNALTRTWDPGFTSRVMARVCCPEWRNSWDQPEDKAEATPSTIIINKIEK